MLRAYDNGMHRARCVNGTRFVRIGKDVAVWSEESPVSFSTSMQNVHTNKIALSHERLTRKKSHTTAASPGMRILDSATPTESWHCRERRIHHQSQCPESRN